MSNDLEKALTRQLETAFDEMGQFIKILAKDYKFSRQVLEKDFKNQMVRRMAIRNFCAEVEGVIHAFKWTVLLCHAALELKLTSAEIAALREEAADLKESGAASPKPQYFTFALNFKFACAMFARAFQCSYPVDYRNGGWVSVKQIFDVRNRLMHPKLLKGVEVSDAEVLALKKASVWLQEVTRGLVESCDFAKVAANAKSIRSSELN